MGLDFYYMPASAPCRTVIMVARDLNITLNLKPLDLMTGEHLKPEFVAINPQHTIPTLHDTDSGLALWESRAIATYLINKHSPGHALYPSDVEKRALIDQRLYFDIGTVYPALAKVLYPQIFHGQPLDVEADKAFKDKLAFLDGFLNGKSYLAGDNRTVADLAVYSSLGMLTAIDYDLAAYANIVAWQTRLASELSYNDEVNVQPLTAFKAFCDAKKAAAVEPASN